MKDEITYIFSPVPLYGTSKGFRDLKNQLWAKNWVVYSKAPFAGPEQVLAYLGRYTHRVAISNHRIENGDALKKLSWQEQRRVIDGSLPCGN